MNDRCFSPKRYPGANSNAEEGCYFLNVSARSLQHQRTRSTRRPSRAQCFFFFLEFQPPEHTFLLKSTRSAARSRKPKKIVAEKRCRARRSVKYRANFTHVRMCQHLMLSKRDRDRQLLAYQTDLYTSTRCEYMPAIHEKSVPTAPIYIRKNIYTAVRPDLFIVYSSRVRYHNTMGQVCRTSTW